MGVSGSVGLLEPPLPELLGLVAVPPLFGLPGLVAVPPSPGFPGFVGLLVFRLSDDWEEVLELPEESLTVLEIFEFSLAVLEADAVSETERFVSSFSSTLEEISLPIPLLFS